jgi:hypothetical protein
MQWWWRRGLGWCLVLLVAVALTGCARGVAEYQLYVQAFNLQYAQGDAILDSVAKAERIVVLRRMKRGPAIVRAFDPNNAAYLVDSIDPPITASIRASAKALKAYNDALGALASGEAATALTNRLGTLSSNLIGAAASAEAAISGAGVVPGASKLISETAGALQLAAPIVQQIATFASREVFRQQLIAIYPAMRNLLLALRNGTPAMFFVLERSRAERGLPTPTGLSDANLATLERDRTQLAGWVVLMDKTLVAMQAAVDAAQSDSLDDNVTGLADTSVELRVLAEKVKSLRAQ